MVLYAKHSCNSLGKISLTANFFLPSTLFSEVISSQPLNLNEELKATGENKPAPQNMPHYLIFNIAERHIGEFCTITNSFLDYLSC